MNLSRYRFTLWLLSRFKIPMIGFCSPKLVELSKKQIVVKIPLGFFTKNHYGSMYFGAQAVGADLAAGFMGYVLCRERGLDSGLVFKDFSAEFLKRPESDVYFVCNQGLDISNQIDESLKSASRITRPITVNAYIHYSTPQQEEVSRFILGLSLKVKTRS
ncbi:PaaI family thioesterase [Schleiferia thermophila]|uniref:PaaI family thioesterase n=1 Tax=Schleiferia thermophila TaxID=884107 RepID=UPI003EE9F8DB